ncbi:MAG TPA: hypothetical protein VF137_06250 [Candidatus Dormibacteraeota bacterium]
MAGPVVVDPSAPSRPRPNFGTATAADIPAFLGVMQVLHQEPNSAAFSRLLSGRLQEQDYIPLAHLFEEISTLAVHGLISEDLLFDAFAFDLYWEHFREHIERLRSETGNAKFCENFETAANAARQYRDLRPAKR